MREGGRTNRSAISSLQLQYILFVCKATIEKEGVKKRVSKQAKMISSFVVKRGFARSRAIRVAARAASSSSSFHKEHGRAVGAAFSASALVAVAVAIGSDENDRVAFSQQADKSTNRQERTLLAQSAATAPEAGPQAPGGNGNSSSINNNSRDANFDVMAALEVREELEKVRMAQLIHDLHKLAQREARKKGESSNSGLKRYVTMTFAKSGKRSSLTDKLESQTFQIQDDGDMMADFLRTTVTPELAQSMIQALKAHGKLSRQSLLSLITASKMVLSKEKSLIDLTEAKGTITVVGDLHGSLHSLSSVLQLVLPTILSKSGTVVFNGDFVDRGEESLEVLCILLILKLAYPDNVVLLRGNHEDDLIASCYGFRDEIRMKYGKGGNSDQIWDALVNLFPVLPLAARTQSAAILHGGLPSMSSPDFDLLGRIESMTLKDRSKITSTSVDAEGDENLELTQDILWSDPDATLKDMKIPNPRGCGVRFGPLVVRDFLNKYNLKYLVRSHELVSEGVRFMNCGKGRAVITVFSSAAYPGGQGSNKGAILHLYPDGSYEVEKFAPSVANLTSDGGGSGFQTIKSMVAGHKASLDEGFRAVEDFWGLITIDQWVEVMAEKLDLPNVPWKSIQPTLAPTTNPDSDQIHWRKFLKQYSGQIERRNSRNRQGVGGGQVQALHANHEMLRTVFKFLDHDNTGSVNVQEFLNSVELLNKHLPPDRQLKDADKLFKLLDVDGDGCINIDEFGRMFSVI